VKDHTYFGKILTNENELRPDIEKGITNINIAYYALLSLVNGQSVLKAEKIKKPNDISTTISNLRSRILVTE